MQWYLKTVADIKHHLLLEVLILHMDMRVLNHYTTTALRDHKNSQTPTSLKSLFQITLTVKTDNRNGTLALPYFIFLHLKQMKTLPLTDQGSEHVV